MLGPRVIMAVMYCHFLAGIGASVPLSSGPDHHSACPCLDMAASPTPTKLPQLPTPTKVTVAPVALGDCAVEQDSPVGTAACNGGPFVTICTLALSVPNPLRQCLYEL